LYENIVRYAAEIRPKAVVIDSIQTLYTSQLQSAPGTVSQVREVAGQLTFFAKRSNIPVIIIGHVTKDGAIAGPRLLEHMVDTVLYFEGDRGHSYRLLRAVKNRFGPVNEIGVFEMRDSGLEEVANPSELFLSERQKKVTGSVIVASMEGTRPILIELQALVTPTNFGMPRRTTVGVDYNRVSMLMAVMEKRAGLHLGNCDVFINVVSGMRIDEPAIDLGIAAAIASSLREAAVDSSTILFGEIGLGGEIRGVSQAEHRIKEAAKLGFKRCILPQRNAERLDNTGAMEIVSVANVTDVMRALF
jgi:DNA repair protein RadA/Sms